MRGPQLFRKQVHGAPRRYVQWEAAGLRWLAQAAALPVVEVVDVGHDCLDLVRLTPVTPTAAAAAQFGAGLARLHDAGAAGFGAAPAGWSGHGFFGPAAAPLRLVTGSYRSWGEFYARARLRPLGRELMAARLLPRESADDLDTLCSRLCAGELDDDDPPARLHGDLWAGNVVWTADGATLVDPAAHGGHRETDLAMLDLFGFPFLAGVLAAYQDVHPLRPGWQGRVGLHQVYPVGVHALLFRGGYLAQLRALLAQWAGSLV